jgi:hypothetical protein
MAYFLLIFYVFSPINKIMGSEIVIGKPVGTHYLTIIDKSVIFWRHGTFNYLFAIFLIGA